MLLEWHPTLEARGRRPNQGRLPTRAGTLRLWTAGDPSDLAAWGEDGNATDDGPRAKVSITNPMTRQAGNGRMPLKLLYRNFGRYCSSTTNLRSSCRLQGVLRGG